MHVYILCVLCVYVYEWHLEYVVFVYIYIHEQLFTSIYIGLVPSFSPHQFRSKHIERTPRCHSYICTHTGHRMHATSITSHSTSKCTYINPPALQSTNIYFIHPSTTCARRIPRRSARPRVLPLAARRWWAAEWWSHCSSAPSLLEKSPRQSRCHLTGM